MHSPSSFPDELKGVERQLKDWFLSRRIRMERTLSLRKMFEKHNVTGLTGAPKRSVGPRECCLWHDLTNGKPELENELSLNAREMKADMYLSMFCMASDLSHPCRLSGINYLTCLKKHYKKSTGERYLDCDSVWQHFLSCRSSIIDQQSKSLSSSLAVQKVCDNRAKELWLQRAALLQRPPEA